MTEEEFREKYPHSTDEQVRLYAEAVAAEKAGVKPLVEPDIPMPMIMVPARVVEMPASITTYTSGFQMRNFSLDDVPPEMPPVATSDEMREILLGTYGFNLRLSPEQRQRLQTTDMSEADMLAMLVGAPNAQEFRELNR